MTAIDNFLGESKVMTETQLEQAHALLTRLREAGLSKSFFDVKLEQAEQVLGLFRQKSLSRFDIFRTVGFYADENHLSDAIAALLNPQGHHQLDLLPLVKLLETIKVKAPQSNAEQILTVLPENRPYIFVHRERPEERTRPDITIIGRDFIIFIENKVRGGMETVRWNTFQTIRQWEVLEDKYEHLYPLRLAVFLSPEGKSAAAKNFVALSVSEMAIALRKAVIEVKNCPYQSSIEAFLDFYTWE